MAEQDLRPTEIKVEDFFTKVLSVIGKTTDQQIADLLKKSKQTVAVAESVTGGLISSRLTSVSGSSCSPFSRGSDTNPSTNSAPL